MHAAPLLRVLRDVGLEVRALELHHAEHQRHRLHQAVGAPDFGGRAGLDRDVTVAGAIDGDARAHRERSRLGFKDGALHALLAQHAARKGVEHELHARLIQQLERDQLEPLRVERHDIAGGERGLDGAARLHELFQ